MLCLVGCATYVDRGPRVRVATEEGDFATAAATAQNFAADEPKDSLVWNLEAGSALRAQGRLKESISAPKKSARASRSARRRSPPSPAVTPKPIVLVPPIGSMRRPIRR